MYTVPNLCKRRQQKKSRRGIGGNTHAMAAEAGTPRAGMLVRDRSVWQVRTIFWVPGRNGKLLTQSKDTGDRDTREEEQEGNEELRVLGNGGMERRASSSLPDLGQGGVHLLGGRGEGFVCSVGDQLACRVSRESGRSFACAKLFTASGVQKVLLACASSRRSQLPQTCSKLQADPH